MEWVASVSSQSSPWSLDWEVIAIYCDDFENLKIEGKKSRAISPAFTSLVFQLFILTDEIIHVCVKLSS